MKTELEKCMDGEWYDCHDKIFIERKAKASDWCMKYNSILYERRDERYKMLKDIFGSIGTNVTVGDSFICGFGDNIYIGNNVSINMRCTLIDSHEIRIGNNILIAPNVQIYTSTHPIELDDRLTPDWIPKSGTYFCRTYASPVTIEDGCWIGAGVIILPGVKIGKESVIGAGSVVTKDIPANSVAVGNPCRVIREINKK
jgi:acetyltransferase-like isoleucine patch superfamily enzyme